MATEDGCHCRLVYEHSGVQHLLPLHRILQRRHALGPLVLAVHERRALCVGKRRLAHLRAPRHAGAPTRIKPTYAEYRLHRMRIPWGQPAGQPQLLLPVPCDRGRQRVQRLVVHAGTAPVVKPPWTHLGGFERLRLHQFRCGVWVCLLYVVNHRYSANPCFTSIGSV